MLEKSFIEKRLTAIAELRHADSVFRDIQAREAERSDYEKRWLWELLQNAKDAVEKTQNVNVKIELNNEGLSFSHTGNPFDLDDILSLILQGSSKGSKDKTGRFGTGFMTTYLLSRQVTISGQLTNGNGYFQFLLDREADSEESFYICQQRSNSAFMDSLRAESYLDDTNFQTKFTYTYSALGLKTAEAGVESLNDLIPLTQLFNDEIESVEVIQNGTLQTFNKSPIQKYTIAEKAVEEWLLETAENATVTNQLTAYIIKMDKGHVCLLTKKSKDGKEIIFDLTDKFPRLYFTFPLIGTEEIGIPFIINSTKFNPRVERDGIYLKQSEDLSDGTLNREIISQALKLASETFSALVVKKDIKNSFQLLNYKQSKDYKWMEHDWLKGIKLDLFNNLVEFPLFSHDAVKERRVSLNEFRIPYAGTDMPTAKLWSLLNRTKTIIVPSHEDLKFWVNILTGISDLRGSNVFALEQIYSTSNLIEFVEKVLTLETLKGCLSSDPQLWLNDFYLLIDEQNSSFPLSRSIILNKNDVFSNAEGMSWDRCKDEKLFKISQLLDKPLKKFLISDTITAFSIPGVDTCESERVVGEIKNLINNLQAATLGLTTTREALARFVMWLIRNDRPDVLQDLKILSGPSKKVEEVGFEIFPKGKHLLLTPKPFFSNQYPLYATIIRDKDCMHEFYNEFLTESDYTYLDINGFVHLLPLVVKKEKADLKTMEALLVSHDDLTYIRDLDGKPTLDAEITYSDFAYLTSTEGHIYDRNTTSTSSLERFKFLLIEACETDPCFDDNFQEVITEQGRKIFFYKTMWLFRAKNNQWVNVHDGAAETKFGSETPSSKNLSDLIKKDPSLVTLIRGAKQQAFLQKLGVGVSDLIRYTLPTDALRNSWDKAITSMLTSNADPELVHEIFSDPLIKKEYEKRLNHRKLIARNQKIGGLIEDLFHQFINELKAKGKKIEIKREPFGSDYLLTNESSDWVNEKNEREGFKINNWLVELKATGKDFASMTPLQAETASTNKESYALVVVPLDTEHHPDLEYIRLNAKVISFIGEKIKNAVNDFNEVETRKLLLSSGKDGISVNIEDQNIRFKVGSTIWHLPEVTTIENFILNKFN